MPHGVIENEVVSTLYLFILVIKVVPFWTWFVTSCLDSHKEGKLIQLHIVFLKFASWGNYN
jgi:hypothetical protein